jgi:hypothetical protein
LEKEGDVWGVVDEPSRSALKAKHEKSPDLCCLTPVAFASHEDGVNLVCSTVTCEFVKKPKPMSVAVCDKRAMEWFEQFQTEFFV